MCYVTEVQNFIAKVQCYAVLLEDGGITYPEFEKEVGGASNVQKQYLQN